MRLTIEWDNPEHFLLQQQAIEVAPLAPSEAPSWLDPSSGLAVLNSNVRPGHQEFEVPMGATYIRFHATFSWAPPRAIGALSTTVLEVTQLFTVMNGTVLASRWSATGMGQGERAVDGLHPLLSVSATSAGQAGPTVRVSTVFVDVTAHWWSLRSESPYFTDWYRKLHRPGTTLRVLAYTSALPLLWFAVVPESCQAVAPIGAHIFYRPLGSDPYAFDERSSDGLENRRHDTSGMYALCRYLLTPVTHWKELDEKNVGTNSFQLLDRFSRGPEDPAFVYQPLLAGLEEAVRRTGRATVLLMPFRSLNGRNEVSNQLAAVVKRALTLLWALGEVSIDRKKLLQLEPSFGLSGLQRGG